MTRNATSFIKGRAKTGGRNRGTPNRVTVEIREQARRLVEDPTYRAALRRRMAAGRAPEMEKLLFFYAYGRPSERLELAVAPAEPEVDLSRLSDLELATMRRLYDKAAGEP